MRNTVKKVALLSNVTLDLLADRLKKDMEVYVPAGFDTWQQEIFRSGSGLYTKRPEMVVVLLHAGAYCDIWNDAAKGKALLEEWLQAVSSLTENLPAVPVFVSSLDVNGSRCRYGAQLRLDAYFENYFIEGLQNLHGQGRSVYVLPVREQITEMGRSMFYSPKMWYMGSMPYSMKGLAALEDLIRQYAAAAKGRIKKCLAVDLDNTLWGGVIGEAGVDGILLSEYKEGARYKDVQRMLKAMRQQGVILTIVSKNNADDVEPVFGHPDMVLQHEDFAAERINWESKPANIRALARHLNLGLDAFVFLDDNPMEREQMKAECPEVTVAAFPADSSLLPDTVEKMYRQYFLTLDVLEEDQKKTAMYQSEAKRREERAASASAADYLRNLNMEIDIHTMKAEEAERTVQLVNKTNQFNVTTRRYGMQEIHRLAESADSDVVTVRMRDKYGEQGLTAVLILKYGDGTADIDTFLMSCRVMGREAEREIMACLRRRLMREQIANVRAQYIRTAKNIPVEQLYDGLGFVLKETNGTPEEIGFRKRYACATSQLPEPTGLFRRVTAFGERVI